MANNGQTKVAKQQQEMESVLSAYSTMFRNNRNKVKIDESSTSDFEFQKRFQEYIGSWCAKNSVKPSLEGFCAYCGVDIQEYKRWKSGAILVSDERKETIREIDAILLACLHEFVSLGQINYAYAIFVLKNDFGYEDKQEHIVAPTKKLLQKQKSNEEIAKILEANSGNDDIIVKGSIADKVSK